MNARRIVLIVLIVLFVVLILENRKNVEVDLIIKSFSIPGAVFYPLLLLLGTVFGWAACLVYKKRGDKKNKKDL